MSRRFSQIVPQSPGEIEQFYLDTIDKLRGTDSTLADEEKKSSLPVVGMVHDLARKLDSLTRDGRNLRLAVDAAIHSIETISRDGRNLKTLIDSSRYEQENRLLRSQITRLEARINDLERRL